MSGERDNRDLKAAVIVQKFFIGDDEMIVRIADRALGSKRVIDLEYIDSRFKGQKIESATVIKETDRLIYLALVADNDDGSSTVFKMSITRAVSLAE